MYNFRARVKPSVIGSVRSPAEMRGQALPRTTAVTPSQALEILSEVTTVPETEVPLVESGNIEEASMPPVLEREIDRSFASTRDTPVNLDDSLYALVPVTAVSATEENNTTFTGTIRIDSRDTRDVSEVSINTNTKNPITTKDKNPNLTLTILEAISISGGCHYICFIIGSVSPKTKNTHLFRRRQISNFRPPMKIRGG